MELFFSVLVPVYNTSIYLCKCIDSILNQTFKDYEIILINDGSSDDSGMICDEYAQKYSFIRVIHKENEGLMMTRRRGFKEAKGSFFICVDSDDYLYDCCSLEKIHRIIIDSNCDLVLYNYVYGAGGGKSERIRQLFDYETGYVFEGDRKKELYEKLITTNSMNNIWIKCPSRHIIDIDTDYSIWKKDICRAEDLFQSYPMLSNATRIGYISEPLYYYRWTENSISNKPKYKYCDAFKCIFQRENEYLARWNVSVEAKEKAIRRRLTLYMNVIVSCYFKSKAADEVDEWKKFVSSLSEDVFFRHILDGSDKKNVLKYYRVLSFLICNRKITMAIGVIEVIACVLTMKRRVLHKKAV